MMESAELDVINAFLRPDAIMFEYGSGGSTRYFSERVRRLVSAEHSAEWLKVVEEQCADLENLKLVTAAPNRAAWEELGCTGVGIFEKQIQFGEDMRVTFGTNLDVRWREATTDQRLAVFGSYVDLIAQAGEPRFDVVLVDGRVRGECAIAALPYLDERSVVIIHDWNLEEEGYRLEGTLVTDEYVRVAKRKTLPSYRRVLEYFDVVCEVSPEKHGVRCNRCGLVVLRKKPVMI